MKILFVNLLDDPADGGGAEVTIKNLMLGLKQQGSEPMILSTSATPGLHETERDGLRVWRAGIRNLYWPGKTVRPHAHWRRLWHLIDSYNPLMQGYLRRVIAIERPDVISLHNLPGWSSATWQTVYRAGIPSVQVLHDQYALCPSSAMFKHGRNCASQCPSCRLLRLPHRALSRKVGAVVGVSRFILDRHLSFGYFANVPVQTVIHNARDAQALGLDTADQVPKPHTGIRIGFIGRLDLTKGIDRLIAAFESLDLPASELWIAGSGKADHEAALRALARSPKVRFLGRLAPRDFYPEVDFVVVPSVWNEPLGMVVAEALAFGKPVLGSTRGGIPEMIQNGVNGFLFDPDDPHALRDLLARLAAHPEQLRVMSSAARVSAVPFLDMRRWVTDYLNLYQRLIDQRGSAPSSSHGVARAKS